MDSLLTWILIGVAAIGGAALYVFWMLDRAKRARRPDEAQANEDGGTTAATSVATTSAAVDASSSSSATIV